MALKPPAAPEPAAAPVSDFGVFAGRSGAFVPLCTGALELPALLPLVTGAPEAPELALAPAGAVVVVELEPDVVAGGAAGLESFGSVVVLPGDCASTGAANARAIARVIVFRFMRISMK